MFRNYKNILNNDEELKELSGGEDISFQFFKVLKERKEDLRFNVQLLQI